MLDDAWSEVHSRAAEATRLAAASAELKSKGHMLRASELHSQAVAARAALPPACATSVDLWGSPSVLSRRVQRLVRRSARASAPRSGSAYESSFEPSFTPAPGSDQLLRHLPQDYLAFVSTLPVQLQVEEGPKVTAARRLAALMSDSQLCVVNGLAEEEFSSLGRDHAVGLFVCCYGCP